MAYKIDKGIPIWPRGGGRVRLYKLDEMAIGDSFFVPDFAAASARVQAAKYQRLFRVLFESRKVPGGVRIWRIL